MLQKDEINYMVLFDQPNYFETGENFNREVYQNSDKNASWTVIVIALIVSVQLTRDD